MNWYVLQRMLSSCMCVGVYVCVCVCICNIPSLNPAMLPPTYHAGYTKVVKKSKIAFYFLFFFLFLQKNTSKPSTKEVKHPEMSTGSYNNICVAVFFLSLLI